MQTSDQSKTPRVKIFAKIKPHSQNDLFNAPLNQNATRRVRSPSPSTSTSKKTTTVKSPSAQDYEYSFYAIDQPGAKKIFYFPNPIQKRMLEESVKSEGDSEQLQSSIFGPTQVFNFDRAFAAGQKYTACY
jgi:hypothetical protein